MFVTRREGAMFVTRGSGSTCSESDQSGMVTVEIAFASLVAAMASVALAWVLAVLGLAARCQDAAAEIARQEARGDQAAVSSAVADRPDGAIIIRARHGEQVVVTVQLIARPWVSWLPGIPISAEATVLKEPA